MTAHITLPALTLAFRTADEGKKIEAIKIIREFTGGSLQSVKKFMDEYMSDATIAVDIEPGAQVRESTIAHESTSVVLPPIENLPASYVATVIEYARRNLSV